MLRGYVELLAQAESVNEIMEVGRDIAFYLETVKPEDRADKRQQLFDLYQANMADIKRLGTRPVPAEIEQPLPRPQRPEPVEELDIPVERDLQAMLDLYASSDVTVEVSTWCARQKNCPVRMTGEIIHRTQKAILFRMDTLENQWEGWLPLSQVTIRYNRPNATDQLDAERYAQRILHEHSRPVARAEGIVINGGRVTAQFENVNADEAIRRLVDETAATMHRRGIRR